MTFHFFFRKEALGTPQSKTGEHQQSANTGSRRQGAFLAQDDPYSWPPLRKNFTLFLIFKACVTAGLAANIQNPAVEDIQEELFTTKEQLTLSLSVFILVQGLAALMWCAISEVRGRKLVYLVSFPLFTAASIVIAVSQSVGLVIGFRAIQAVGSSAVITIGAATLIDIFQPAERGTKMGIYSVAPILGPALSPIIGGSLTTSLGWRSISWFLCLASGLSWLLILLFFRETFRKEKSLIYQISPLPNDEKYTPSKIAQPTPAGLDRGDLERAEGRSFATIGTTALPSTTLPPKDANPLKPIGAVLRRIDNVAILFSCATLFALTYLITYTSARTLATIYMYRPLIVGAVTATFGFGCVCGSLSGGRWSDYKLARLAEANEGTTYPRMRLKSALIGVFLLPPCIFGFGWACEYRLHVGVLCTLLFITGFFTFWIYASALAYLADANAGRTAGAMAAHSASRGIFASISVVVVVPTRGALGDGWLYTVLGIVTVLSGILITLVSFKGEQWRKWAEERESWFVKDSGQE